MAIYWICRGWLTYSGEFAAVTYDRCENIGGIRVPVEGPSSCVWIVPGTHVPL